MTGGIKNAVGCMSNVLTGFHFVQKLRSKNKIKESGAKAQMMAYLSRKAENIRVKEDDEKGVV